MPSPDACLIVLFTALALAWYLFWVLGVLTHTRTLLVVLAVVSLAASIVVHDLETANLAQGISPSRGDRGAADPP
jgi:hypothetical protein